METQIYRINVHAARNKGIPAIFAAIKLKETDRAVYLYGHGTKESAKLGVCMICGRALTHPVSVELGIGPECGHHYWDWDLIGGYTKENIKRVTEKIQSDIKVDGWIPKSVIKGMFDSDEIIRISSDHPMLNGNSNNENKMIHKRQAVKNGNSIDVFFPFSWEDVDKVKSLPGRQFHSDRKYWSCPVSIDAIEKLMSWHFHIDQTLLDILESTKLNVNDVEEIEIPGLKGVLYPFQKKGVAFIEAKQGRALIADEMGLGKTIQALAWLELHPEIRPALIVVPASLKLNWKKEATQWMRNPKTQILSGKTPYPITGEVVIINYDVLVEWVDTLININFKTLILDEVHYIKNNLAKRTKAVKRIGKGVSSVIGLTGTPIVNRPIEAFNAIKMINPTIVPDRMDYAFKYCGAHHNGYGWDFNGATNTGELHELLVNTIMLRRLKKDVLHDLPDKVYSYTPMELDNEDEYFRAEANFIRFLKESKGVEAAQRASNAAALAEIEGLKQLAVKGKIKSALTWIEDALDSNGKLVVFCTHKFVVDELMRKFESVAVKIDGSVSQEGRQIAIDRFQNDPVVRLFIGNVKAAGVGITLTASSNVVFLELPWTPGDLTQAEDRCHRIGQKDSVNVYYLLASNTIEEKIAKMIDNKRKVLDSVLDGKITEQESLLSELMKEYES
jgi:SWI/SNF-related matrix-associated actin-dependent regulator of chromatin subfamily A-like protein 1